MDTETQHTAEGGALHALAAKCRDRLDALPAWAQPSWYRLRGIPTPPRFTPPEVTHCANCGAKVPVDRPHKVGECVIPPGKG